MRRLNLAILVSLLFNCCNLWAQVSADPAKQSVFKVFELFFESMQNRDTVSLKKIIRSQSSVFFMSWKTESEDMIITGGGGGSFKGFMNSVGNPDGMYGKCRNEFNDFEIHLYEGIAIVSAKYWCFLDGINKNNCGRYIIQFQKSPNNDVEEGFEWKVSKVDRIVFNKGLCD